MATSANGNSQNPGSTPFQSGTFTTKVLVLLLAWLRLATRCSAVGQLRRERKLATSWSRLRPCQLIDNAEISNKRQSCSTRTGHQRLKCLKQLRLCARAQIKSESFRVGSVHTCVQAQVAQSGDHFLPPSPPPPPQSGSLCTVQQVALTSHINISQTFSFLLGDGLISSSSPSSGPR